MSHRILIADDHPLILDSLESLIAVQDGLEVVGRATDGANTLRLVHALGPDLLLLDIRMPGLDGLEVLRRLNETDARPAVILFTGALTEQELLEALRLGVRGVVLKEMEPSFLVQAIHKVLAGEIWVEKQSFTRALETMLRREAAEQRLTAMLTRRELEIAHMVAGGLRNREIAERLFLTEGTVKVHIHNVYQKLGVTRRMELNQLLKEEAVE